MKLIIGLLVCVTLAACDRISDADQATATAAEEVKETPAYALAVAEAGAQLDPGDPRVAQTALLLFDASKFFNASEKEISNVAYYHAKQLRKSGVAVTANELITAAMKSVPRDVKPSIASLNLFGTMYQTAAKS